MPRRAVLFVVVVSGMLPVSHTADAATPSFAAQKCRKAIGEKTRKLAVSTLQSMQRCYLGALAAGEPNPEICLDPADPRIATDSRVVAAEAKLRGAVGGGANQCSGIAGPSALSYPGTCPAPCNTIIVGSFTTLADCLACLAQDRAAQAAEDEFGTLVPPVAPAGQRCLEAIAKAGLKQFEKRLNAMVKCQKKVDVGRSKGDCTIAVFFDSRGRVAKIEDDMPVIFAADCPDARTPTVQTLDICDPPATTSGGAAACTALGHAAWARALFDEMFPFSPAAPLPVCATPPAITTIAPIDTGLFPVSPSRPYAPLPGGRIWYVSPDGNDGGAGTELQPLRSVNAAYDNASPGDVILVGAGIYYLQDSSDASWGLVLEKNDVTLANVAGDTVILRPNGATHGISVTGDRVVVDGFDIQGFGSGGIYFGRLSTSQQQVVLKNLTIEGGLDGIRAAVAPTIPNPTALIQGLLLENLTIAGSRSTLVGFNCGEGPCNDVKMQNVLVMMGGGGAGNSGADAIAMESGDNVLVVGSRVTGASADGFDFKCTRVAIINSIASRVVRNGIKLWKGGDIVNSLIVNTGADAAVVFEGAGAYRVLNSVVAYHSVGAPAYSMTVGYGNTDAIALDIVNSIFFRNSGGAYASGTTNPLNVRNSLFFGSENGEEFTWDKAPPITVGAGADPITALEAAGGGADNLGFVDPMFVDPANDNWTLQSPASPALDAGTAAVGSFPTYDILCNPRVVGGAPDLGAYEHP